MKKLVIMFIIGALGACGDNQAQRYAAPQAPQQPQIVYVPASVDQQQPQVVYQQAPQQPQAAQTNSGPGWGAVAAGVIGGAILGHVLTDKKPQPVARDVYVQDNRYNYDSRRYAPKPVQPLAPPKPNTVAPSIPAPKPTVVAPVAPPKPSFAPTSSYVQKSTAPTYSAPPKTSYSVPTSKPSYSGGWSSNTTRR